MEPWQSWTVVAVLGGATYWYYSTSGQAKKKDATKTARQSSVVEERPARSKARRDDKGKSRKDTIKAEHVATESDPAADSSTSQQSGRKKKGKSEKRPQNAATPKARDVPANVEVDEAEADEGMDNKEFARQLASLKKGSSLNAPSQAGAAPKTKKARDNAKNAGLFAGGNDQYGSSTGGADGDDDLSPVASPSFGAVKNGDYSGDVSDMLEAPSSGPSVLRLTESNQPQRQKQQKAKVAEPQETKKQRQNRLKNEAKKVEREQQEKERRVLLEKQLRTAREAEGRPAKNGVAPAKAPVQSAWAQGNNSTGARTPQQSSNSNMPLLHTFEPENKPPVRGSESQNGAATQSWQHDLPSEEDQMKMISQLNGDDGWNTVGKPKKGKKKPAETDFGGNDSSASSIAGRVADESSASTSSKTEVSDSGVQGFQDKWAGIPETERIRSHPMDSDWAA